MGFISVFFRQTNIIWCFWIVVTSILEMYERQENGKDVIGFIKFIFKNLLSILYKFWLFALLGISFVIFVIWNNGIVLGNI